MKVAVVLPAFNAEHTLEEVLAGLPKEYYDNLILVDDGSSDRTYELAKEIGVPYCFKHEENKGYGANQKTCYNEASKLGVDVIVMLHPDAQYDASLIPEFVKTIKNEGADLVLGSRIKGGRAIENGMPAYKFVFNKMLTLFQNVVMNQRFSEYHTGFRAFKMSALQKVDYDSFSDGFLFDNQMILSFLNKKMKVKEIEVAGVYSDKTSSINLINSVKYGVGVVHLTVKNIFWDYK